MPDIDLTTDTWTPEERARTVRWYELAHGTGDTRLAPFVPFSIDNNPAGFKRYRSLVPTLTGAVPRGIFFVHLYAVIGNANGCLYEIIASRQNGFIKRQIIDVLNFSFLTGGPQGINAVAEAASGYLQAWDDDRTEGVLEWPDGWTIDPDGFKSGIAIDASTVGFSSDELQQLTAWHERISGEVPRYVELWARLRGGPYKANRSRYEVAPGETLPIQVYPLLLMHVAAFLERTAMLRQALLHARGLGVALEHVVEILDTAFVYSGEWKMAGVLTDEICDILEKWDR